MFKYKPKIFCKKSIWVSKNNADFKFVDASFKNAHIKVLGQKLQYANNKYYHFYTLLMYFVYNFFLNSSVKPLSKKYEISVKFCVFEYLYLFFAEKV
jgi:hypothetical protein